MAAPKCPPKPINVKGYQFFCTPFWNQIRHSKKVGRFGAVERKVVDWPIVFFDFSKQTFFFNAIEFGVCCVFLAAPNIELVEGKKVGYVGFQILLQFWARTFIHVFIGSCFAWEQRASTETAVCVCVCVFLLSKCYQSERYRSDVYKHEWMSSACSV